MPIVFVILSFALGLAGTLAMEALAPRLGLVQAPNARSSHKTATARGGGVAIALASIIGGFAFAASGGFLVALVLAALIAALGFMDDLADLSPAIRFPVQAVVFAALIWSIGPIPEMLLLGGASISGWVLSIGLLIAGLWWLNLFNFMDGIDGLAGIQAMLLLICALLVWSMGAQDASASPMFWFMLACAAAAAGFLVRNWPPARIFMGDAGSNCVALLIFFIALWTVARGTLSYQVWLILGAAFITDATVTLLRRLRRGEKPWHAHRRHAYQQLSRRLGHLKTTLLYSAVTLVWAFPLAMVSQLFPESAWLVVLIAYAPLITLAILNGAGAATET